VVTSLKEEELHKHVLIPYKPNAKYAYTAGQAQSRYLLGLKEGKILGRKCVKCGKIYVPPKMYCDECFRPTDIWVEVMDEGYVMTAVASFISWTREKISEPELVGVIRLLPSNPRDFVYPGIFHRLCVSYEEVRNMSVIGKRVKAVWRPKEERKASIEDIQCFKVI